MQLHADELRSRLEPLFRENFEKHGELGAAVSIWQNGRAILDLHGGFCDTHRQKPWTTDTLVLIWSATKGLASACLLHVLQEHKIDIDRRVAEFWPEFAQAGKDGITFAQLLSHQAGLCALDRPVDVLNYPAVIEALERQKPIWPPGSGHGYHVRTFGFLLDELVRRITGEPLSNYWRKSVGETLDLDVWIGLPDSEQDRVATMYAAKAGKPPEPRQFYADLATPGTLARRTFTSPRGLHAISAMNAPKIRAQPVVSFGGIGSAASLAKFYAVLANNGRLLATASPSDGGQDRPASATLRRGVRLFSSETLALMTTTLTEGPDRVFQIPTAFSAGFMKDVPNPTRRIFGPSTLAFGHPGAGGSHAFADLENGIAFAYVMNQMEQSLLPNEKSLRLVRELYKDQTRR